MVFGILFSVARVFELLTMIPVLGIMGWYIHGFAVVNILTPDYILVLFIVSVVAVVWALLTLIAIGSTRRSGIMIGLIDIGVLGGLIAGIYILRGIGTSNCASASWGAIDIDLGPFGVWGESWGSPYAQDIDQNCGLLKAAWALAIINCFLWPFSGLFAILNWERDVVHHEREVVRDRRSYAPSSSRGYNRRTYV
jgi:hypothetical protein